MVLSEEEREQLLADLAWDFTERLARREGVELQDYLDRCPDDEARNELRIVIGMSALSDAVFHREPRR
jgi:hypothetical protein